MKSATKIILSALVLFAVFIWTSLVKSPTSDGVQLHFFDVGQGDAALIQKGEYQILVDGGPSDEILSKLGQVMPLTDRNIEIIVLSHPHADHLVGINQVLERYNVEKVYSSGVLHASNEYLEFLETIKEKEIELIIPNIGFELETFENSKIEFLWPGERYSGESMENINNSSEVVRFCYFDECAILLGDLETDGQRMLGIDIDKRFTLMFGLAAAVAGLAGVMYTPILSPDYHLGMDFLVLSFVVVVVGGMGSLTGAVAAGFLLGILQSFASMNEVKDIFPGIDQIIIYLVAVVILLMRPRGLMGRKGVMET